MGVWSVCFNPEDGRIATAGGDGTARIWDAVSGKQVAVLEAQPGKFSKICFSPDGSRLLTTSEDGTARLWIARESAEDQARRIQVQYRLWREQQASDAERAGRWFAAAFHLKWLLKDDPMNAELRVRRDAAEAHLKAR